MKQQPTVVIFAGAGASKAVAPEQYPTTAEFFEGLPAEITEDPLFQQVVAFLRRKSEDTIIDIEQLLWRLAELNHFCIQFEDQEGISGWILAGNRLGNAVLSRGLDISPTAQLLKSCSHRLRQITSEINARVYDLYSKVPTSEQLSTTWTPLLEGLIGIGAKVELVTTNYDMILETALDENKVSDIGWRGSIVRNLDTSLWQGERTRGLLTKLHGSVNWTRSGDQIFVSDPMFKGDHNTHVIIYPGFKGRPGDATFLSFHNHFARALSDATVAVFIGFSFRDDYINDLCDRNTTSQTKVGVLNPTPGLQLPFSNTKPHYWKKRFDSSSTRDMLNFIQQSLDA